MRTTPALVGLGLMILALPACAPQPVASASLPPLASGAASRGGAYAARYCARCHSLGLEGPGPDRQAPPFRVLSGRYVGPSLEQKFEAIARSGHYAMRTLRLRPNEAKDLAAYMDSLVQE